jgi:ligand-binding sensor domain-containing protein
MRKKFLFLLTPIIINLYGQSEPWEATTPLPIQRVEALFISANDIVFAGSFGGGLFRSSNGGSTWDNIGLQYYAIKCINVTVLGEIYVGTTLGLFRSVDNGITWKDITPIFNTPNNSKEVSSISLQENDQVYIGFIDWGYNQSGVFYSSDKGDTWENKTKISSYSMQTTREGEIYLGTQNNGLLYSRDKGNTWSLLYDGLTIKSVCLTNSDKIIIGQPYGRISISDDHGKTWDLLVSDTSYTGWFRDHGLNCIIVDSSETNLFVSLLDIGVYKYSFNTNMLSSFNNGLPYGTLYSIGLDNQNNLYVSTKSYGVYKYKNDYTVNVDEGHIMNEFILHQNYPNPFNPNTKISFSIPKRSYVTIKIYDVSGKEVMTLIDEEKNCGNHVANLNFSGLPSGVYYYRMTTTGFSKTMKMLFLK